VDNARARLTKCFEAVFPDLKPEEVSKATTATLKNWDSVASVTLFTLMEEEFNLNLDIEVLDEFSSFERILAQIEKR
jgi:acyl carrier protein